MGAKRRLLVDEACGLPGDTCVREFRPHGTDELLRAIREPLFTREEVEAPEAGRDLPCRQDSRGPRSGREAGGHGLRRRTVRDHGDRRVSPADAVAVERFGNLAGARRRRQRRRVDADEVDAERGQCQYDQHGGGENRDPSRPSHHGGGEPTPASTRRWLLQPAWCERVDPRAEPVEECR